MARRLVSAILLIGLFTTMCGCHRALFTENDKDRTQFDSYDTIRHGPMITEQPNEYGLAEPAIRNRLGRHRR
ncbi:MAG: hypothetical protein HOC93_01450 [Phycisphaerae bacterium]|jgi:hypothetical protein|nr:hypothetical protein [Phycisphaerae bacterium]HJN71946.1 hypothetical protein [Phycisphaerales bacterium]